MAADPYSAVDERNPRRRFVTAPSMARDESGSIECTPLRTITLGVLLDGRMQEGWVLASLRQALAVSGVRMVAIAVVCGNPGKPVASRFHGLLDWLDRQLRCRNERLLAAVDVATAIAAPLFDVEIAWHGDGWRPTEAGAAALRRCEVDVWLCFTDAPPRHPLYSISRFGVWGIEIGHGISAVRDWAGAIEVGGGSPLTMVSVVDYAQSGNVVLYRSFSATVRNSIGRNRLDCLRKGVSFFRRLIERLMRDGGTWRSARAAPPTMPAHYPVLREPTFSSLFRISWRQVSNVVANRWHSMRWLDQWQIAYSFGTEVEAGFQPDNLRYLVPPRDRFWADPFAVEHDGRHFIFFEELQFRTEKGRIMAIEVFENGEPGEPQVALERPYHLSYPFVFAWEGSLYMMPETAANRTVEVYRCEAFPLRWRLHRILLENISAYDATLSKNNDQWWMFVNVAEPGADSSDELHVYWGMTPLGPWTAHHANPVVSDVRCARPAGPLFSRDGILYRPSQDCSVAYGHSVLINRVDVLDENDYRETPVCRITPDWRKDALRIHTVGGNQRLRVIDYLVSRKQRF
jgi:hypothetical protein